MAQTTYKMPRQASKQVSRETNPMGESLTPETPEEAWSSTGGIYLKNRQSQRFAMFVQGVFAVTVISLVVLVAITRSDLATTRSDLTTDLANTQGDLSQTQGDLSETQGELSETQRNLTTTQNDLTYTKGELSTTKGNLANTLQNLSSTWQTLLTTQRDLGTTRSELSAIQWNVTIMQGDLAKLKLDSGLTMKLYAVGGNAGHSYLKTAEVFDPATGKWSAIQSMGTQREGPGVAACC